MMNLSQVYDHILSDPELTFELYQKMKSDLKSPILECACGSGDLLKCIQADFDNCVGIDLDLDMLTLAKNKGVKNTYLQNMLDLSNFRGFNTILCVGDSLNYLLEVNDIKTFFKEVYQSLNNSGLFLFDMHSLDRLKEFEEEYIEEADMLDYQYQWTILTQGDYLSHQFVFFSVDDTIKQNIIQRVYPLDLILESLTEVGFRNIHHQLDDDKEKITIKARKEEL